MSGMVRRRRRAADELSALSAALSISATAESSLVIGRGVDLDPVGGLDVGRGFVVGAHSTNSTFDSFS